MSGLPQFGSTPPQDVEWDRWARFLQPFLAIGLIWRGAYTAQATYRFRDVVHYNSGLWTVVTGNSLVGITPGTDARWQLMLQGVPATTLSEFLIADQYPHKVFSYLPNDDLDKIDYYADALLTDHRYEKQFNYNVGGDLVTQVLTRIADAAVFTKTFTYDVSENLTNIDVT